MFFSKSSHADPELATSIQTSSQRLQDVSRLSVSVAGRFAQAAQLASMFVLPDVKLAVKEKEPTLAASLLAMQEDSLAQLRTQGDDMQRQHTELQSSVQGLIAGTQSCKPDYHRSCLVSEKTLDEQPNSPRSVQTSSTEYESAGHSEQSSDDGYQSSDDGYQPRLASVDGEVGDSFDTSTFDSEASLLRELEVLKKADDIIEAGLGFWQHVNATVHKLTQMKQHTSCLVQCANSSERLHARIEQRVDEYNSTWVSLDLSCQQYIAQHEQSEIPMHELSHKLEHRVVALAMSSNLPLRTQ